MDRIRGLFKNAISAMRTIATMLLAVIAVMLLAWFVSWLIARRCPFCASKNTFMVMDSDYRPIADWWLCRRCGSFF